MIDVNTIQELLVTLSWVTPIVIGLVAVVRATLKLEDRWVPAASLFVGVGISALLLGFSLTALFVGLVMGLTASGFYDVTKKTLLNQ